MLDDLLHRTLIFALRLKRPYGGYGEEALARFVESQFEGLTHRDDAGNVHLDLRAACSRTLFVAHMDTVHREDGPNKIGLRGNTLRAKKGKPLGADDGAGVAMLVNLANRGVPGYYLFTRGEERGGIGSSWLAKNEPNLLLQFDRAIAFDRKGTDSIITHQGMGRCCSDKFGEALAAAFNSEDDALWYTPDNTGVYTDTAEFTDQVPECTNISVGYEHEHSDKETLDLDHFDRLAAAALNLQWEDLPVARDPNAIDPDDLWRWHDYKLASNDDDLEEVPVTDPLDGRTRSYYDEVSARWDLLDALNACEDGRYAYIRDLIANAIYPEDVTLANYALRDFQVPSFTVKEALERMDSDSVHGVLLWLYEECSVAV